MKKLLILFFATSLFVACNNDKKDDRRSSRDRDKEKDDYRSRDDEEKDDSRNTDYKDDEKGTRDKDEDRGDTRKTSDGWPQSSKDEFVNSCVREAVKNGNTRSYSERYCECMVDKMESLYPDVEEVAKLTEEEVGEIVERYKAKCQE
ncbi:MAG: hypothetical protein KAX45_06775 [Chitinophagaceae bacterium]|nr:hypothetical protein [Chitinophagaceae bacterium]